MKYFKPASLTWWASFVPLAMGTFAASEPLHGLSVGVLVVDNLTGGIGSYALINAGLVGIGMRGALR